MKRLYFVFLAYETAILHTHVVECPCGLVVVVVVFTLEAVRSAF